MLCLRLRTGPGDLRRLDIAGSQRSQALLDWRFSFFIRAVIIVRFTGER